MSNNVVGNVYQQVIEDVINASRVDFEEGGVDEGVLEELKRGWQQKLSQLDVASFPWDPKTELAQTGADSAPPPPQQQQQQQAQPSTGQNAPYSQPTLSPQPNFGGLPLPGGGDGGNGSPAVKHEQQPFIKQEPGLPGPSPSMIPQMPHGDLAQQRAMQNITQKFGDQASNKINVQSGASQRSSGQPPLPQMPTQGHVTPQQQQQAPNMAHVQQQGQQQQHPPAGSPPAPGFENSQLDGAVDGNDEYDEVQGVLMRRDAEGTLHELGRVDIDRMMHSQILSNAKAMEGGGLMLPLQEATRHRTAASSSRKGKGRADVSNGGVALYDGGDDDEDGDGIADEDAINSDLDDPDEEKEEDEVDDEGLGHIMLCMYDKVQRVKNKWKCVLKDGVLTVNGKEYVFHKATGEYEW